MVEIQIQQVNGNWRTYQHVMNESMYITRAMQSLSRSYPGKRIRAAMGNRVVDIL